VLLYDIPDLLWSSNNAVTWFVGTFWG